MDLFTDPPCQVSDERVDNDFVFSWPEMQLRLPDSELSFGDK